MVNTSVDSEIRSAPAARKSKGVDCAGGMLGGPDVFNAPANISKAKLRVRLLQFHKSDQRQNCSSFLDKL